MVLIVCTAVAFGVIAACSVPVFFRKKWKQEIHQTERSRLHAVLNSQASSAQSSRIENNQESSGIETDGSSEIDIKISGLSRTKLLKAVTSGRNVRPARTAVPEPLIDGNRGSTSTPLLRLPSNTTQIDVSNLPINKYAHSTSVRSFERENIRKQKLSGSKKPQLKKTRVSESAATSLLNREGDQTPQTGSTGHPTVESPAPGTSSSSNKKKTQSLSSRYNASRHETPKQRKPSTDQFPREQDLLNTVRYNKPTLPRMDEVEENTVHLEEDLSLFGRAQSPLSLPLLTETTPLSSRMETCIQSGVDSDSSAVLDIKISGLSRSKLWNLMAKNSQTKPKRIISLHETPCFQSSTPEVSPGQSPLTEPLLSNHVMEESSEELLQIDIEDWETGSDDMAGHRLEDSQAAKSEIDETVLLEKYLPTRERKTLFEQRGKDRNELWDFMEKSKTPEPEDLASQSSETTEIQAVRKTPEDPTGLSSPQELDESTITSNFKTPEPHHPPKVSYVKTPEPNRPFKVSNVKTPETDQPARFSYIEAPEPAKGGNLQLDAVPSTSSTQVERPVMKTSKNEQQVHNGIHNKLWTAMTGTTKYI